MEVFYCTMPRDEFRQALARPCLMRWLEICDPQTLTVIQPPEGMAGIEFQGWRRQAAEDRASGNYIIADDDCMPMGNRFLERCEDLIERYTEYGLLGTLDYGMPTLAAEVVETSTGGGINVIRKGIVKVPKFDGQVWTSVQGAEQIRSRGFKIGRMRDVRRNHLGEGFSTVWPDNYVSERTQVGYLNHEGALV